MLTKKENQNRPAIFVDYLTAGRNIKQHLGTSTNKYGRNRNTEKVNEKLDKTVLRNRMTLKFI